MPRGNKKNTSGAGSIRKKTVHRNGTEYTYWEARFTTGFDPKTGKQKQRSITGKTQKEVAQKLRKLTVELDAGTYHEPCRMTVAQWLETWQKDYLLDVKPSTAYLYGTNINLYINPHIGAMKLGALTTPTVQAFYNDLLHPSKPDVNPLSPKTIKNVHGVLHKALKQAVLCGHIRSNPADGCVLPRIVKKEISPLDEDHISLFLKAVHGHPHEYLYKITLFTGLRQGEVLGLTWDCVDFQNGTLTIKQQLRREQKKGGQYYFSPTKNGKTRVISLAPTVLNLFQLQKAAQVEKAQKAGCMWEENNLIFTNELGSFLSYRTVYDCYKRVVAGIGIPDARFHDLRHSYAYAAIKSGDDIKTVQENLGHATAAFTLDVYGHVTKQMKQESANRMERFIQSVSSQ